MHWAIFVCYRCWVIALAFALFFWSANAISQVAFPGAVGFGSSATGGRGYRAIHVTNLNDSGHGSFREAVSKPNAIVVFDINGIIELKTNLEISSNITVAGQTAPGDGIMLYGAKVSIPGKNVILRYLRLRGGIAESPHASSLNISDAQQIIVDHASIQWGRWDDIQAARSSNITIQYSLIGESLAPQRFGCLCESDYMTLNHNLWIDNESRNPKGKGHIQYINNIIYNWGGSGYVGGHSEKDRYTDLLGNYFIKGPSSKGDAFLAMFWPSDHVYQTNNMVDLNKNGKLDGRHITNNDFALMKATVSTKSVLDRLIPVQVDTPESAFKDVANNAGDILCRDSVDKRLIYQALSLGGDGRIIDSEKQVGGAPMLRIGKAPIDTDQDGIPDAWEKVHHLNSNDPNDARKVDLSTGYSYLEEYINAIADKRSTEMLRLLSRPADCQ
jgi:hypothetical protein